MPTYEYLCTSCQNAWEEIQKISENPTEVCPKCGQSTARRQISGGNFILKGGGWYADLYSSSKPKGGADTNGKPEKASSDSSAAKSDSKAAPKSDTKADPKPANPSGGGSSGGGSSGGGSSGSSSSGSSSSGSS